MDITTVQHHMKHSVSVASCMYVLVNMSGRCTKQVCQAGRFCRHEHVNVEVFSHTNSIVIEV